MSPLGACMLVLLEKLAFEYDCNLLLKCLNLLIPKFHKFVTI